MLRRVLVISVVASTLMLGAGTVSANTLVGGPITGDTTWTLAASPYEVTSDVVVYNNARLTIQAGVTVFFRSGAGLIIGYYNLGHCGLSCSEQGAITVNGTEAAPVLFTPLSGSAGDWKGLAFGDASDYGGWASTLSYLTVEKAGEAQTMGGTVGATSADLMLFNTGTGFTFDHVTVADAAGVGAYVSSSVFTASAFGAHGNTSNGIHATASTVALSGASVASNGATGLLLSSTNGSVSGSSIDSNAGYGIDVSGGSPTISGNTVSNNGNYAIRYGIAGTSPSITGNTLSGNANPGIEVVGGALTSNHAWHLQSGEPFYTVTGNEVVVYNMARLTVDGGIAARFSTGTGLIIGYYGYGYCAVSCTERGALTVNGTVAEPVLFTSLSGSSGGWRGLAFGDAADYAGLTSSVAYLTVEKAGQFQTLGGSVGSTSANLMLFSIGTGLTFDHVTVADAAGAGAYVSSSVFTASAFGAHGNTSNGVNATASTLTLSGATVASNGATGLLLSNTNGTVSGSSIDSNAGYGIDVSGGSPTISGSTVSNNGNYAIRYGIAGTSPSISGNTLSGNANPGIEMIGGALTSDHAWRLQSGEPFYTVTGNEVVVSNLARLTVDGGITARFSTGTGLIVGYFNFAHCALGCAERGAITVNGTAVTRVLFTSLSGNAEGWKGLAFGDASDHGGWSSSLSYLTVEKAGQAQTLGGTVAAVSAGIMLFQTGTNFAFDHVEANDGSGVGWYSYGSSLGSSPVPATAIAARRNASWNLMLLNSSSNLGSAVLTGSTTGGAYIDGSTATFTSGDITLNGEGIRARNSAALTISGATIDANRGYALYTEDLASTVVISAVTVSDNGSGADGVSGTGDDTLPARVSANSTVSANVFSGNARQGIEMIGGTITANRHWYLPGSGDFQPYHLLNETVVYNSARLTIDGGVEVRFASGTGLIIGYYNYDRCALNCSEIGALSVDGTASAPVLFTSLSGSAGGWKGIAFGSASDYGGWTSAVSYLTVEKAGEAQTLGGTVASTSANLMLFYTGTGFRFDNLNVLDSAGSGIYSFFSVPTVRNSIVAFNATTGLFADQSSPSFTYGDVFGNGSSALNWPLGTGSIQADPLFVGFAAGDYRLQLQSPCIDTGIDVGLLFAGSAPDMGSFEVGAAPTNGLGCASNAECTSGYCVDGVCCGSACGGGTNDCQACSVAAGGAIDGTCSTLTGTTCDDGDACTQTDTCQSGACTGGNPVACTASDQCHDAGTCNAGTGSCSNPNKTDGVTCTDDNACTGGDMCSAGNCQPGNAVICDDHDVCTDDSCAPASGCVTTNNTAPCPDATLCNGDEVCSGGLCRSGTPLDCDDTDLCTTDYCDPADGCVSAGIPVEVDLCSVAGKAKFQVGDSSAASGDKLKWKWSEGDAFDQVVIGSPDVDTAYALCVYDTRVSLPTLAVSLRVDPSAQFWKNHTPKGWSYSDGKGTAFGVKKMVIKPGKVGKTKVKVTAGGNHLQLPGPGGNGAYFAQDPTVLVQLLTSGGQCWTSEFAPAGTRVNSPTSFAATAP